MNYSELTKEQLLTEIDNKSKAIINLGKQLHLISNTLEIFDFFIIAILNRTINLNRGFSLLLNDNNFIAAAPLVRISMDTLLRLFASSISEPNRNDFAHLVMGGTPINQIKSKISSKLLTDTFLYSELSKLEDMGWVEKIYKRGNSFVHFSEALIFSSLKLDKSSENKIIMTIGMHDEFISDEEKNGAVICMNKITDIIIVLTQLWFYEKAKANNFNIEDLNIEF